MLHKDLALNQKQNTAFYLAMLAYISINIVLYMYNFMWLSVLPAVIIIVCLLIYYPRNVLFFIALATPLSVKLSLAGSDLGITLPTEPLMILMMLLFWLKLFLDGDYDKRIWKHPITIILIFNLVWIFITSCTSVMPIVSFKFLLARLWYITCFYFIGILVFRNFANIKTFIWLFCFSLAFVVIYTLKRHAAQLFEQSYTTIAPQPFFMDHGIYAAVMCLMLPVMIIFAIKRKPFGHSTWHQFFAIIISGFFITGTFFSYTRAAWIGLAVSVLFLFIFLFRIRFLTLLITAVMMLGILAYFRTEIYFKLAADKKVSSSSVEQHLQSMYNISTDASNLERINRWHSALRMFYERPILGWGPNTYMFQYAPFQLSNEMTIISVRTGTQGNAHSEYIGPLADEGIVGLLSAASLIIVSLIKAMELIYKGKNSRIRLLALAAILGLITYFVHGFLNDYLDQDKAAVPVFSFMAIITALDIYYQRNNNEENDVNDGEGSHQRHAPEQINIA